MKAWLCSVVLHFKALVV